MKKVLLIENNDLVRENATQILEMAPYQVLKAENDQQGLALALKQKPDVVLCDFERAEIDGYGVLQVFSKIPDLASIPFIFLSTSTEWHDNPRKFANEAGKNRTRPCLFSELLSTIESRLHQADRQIKPAKQSVKDSPDKYDMVWPHPELECLVQDKKTYFYKKKQIIYLEGNEPSRLFFIKKGKVKIYRSNAEGKEFITGICREGEFFGYLALIEETEYQEAAETLEDAEIAIIPKEEFFALLYHNHFIAKRLIKMLAHSVTEKEQWLTGMAYNSLRKRTADSLLFLNERYQTKAEPHPSMQISRDDIAGLVGSSTESLIRTLSEFKSEHLIDIVNGKIVILDPQKLQHLRK